MNEIEYSLHLHERKKDAKNLMNQSNKMMNNDKVKTNMEVVGAIKIKEKKNEKLQ